MRKHGRVAEQVPVSRRGLPVALVGAGLPDLQVRLIAAKPYADRLFQYRELGRLTDATARGALVGPAATLAEHSPITLADLDTVREIVTDSLERTFFGLRFQLASDAEQRYLAAMAALGDPPYRSSEVATR